MAEGWIKLHRKSYDNFLYKSNKPHTRREAWEDILLNVNYIDSFSLIGNTKFECKRGQSIMSLESWGSIFNWDKSKVKRFFDLLVSERMLCHENVFKTTRITVCNYDDYQGDRNPNEILMKSERNPNETLMKPIEESKEEKESKEREEEERKARELELLRLESLKPKKRIKKPFVAPTLEEVEKYFAENGYTKESAKRAFNCYDVADWFDSKGNPVLSWKQKMQNVWFKDENKIKGFNIEPKSSLEISNTNYFDQLKPEYK